MTCYFVKSRASICLRTSLQIFKCVCQYFASASAPFIRYNNSSRQNWTRMVKIQRKLEREMRASHREKRKKKKKKNAGRVIENEILLSSIYNFCMYSYAATCFAVCVPFSSFYIFSFIFYFWSDLSLKQDRKSTIILLQPITL